MKAIWVKLGKRSYPIYVGKGLLSQLPKLLSRHGLQGRAAVVTDTFLEKRFGRPALRRLRSAGWQAELKALPRGERAKSLAAVEGLYGFLLRASAERRTPLIAIGGGTVGDSAGFAAATYYRGIPLVHVPTTLLAQVDSSIGGKTAVNHPLAKNAIGAFHQPAFVLADVDVLRSLPPREFLSGLSEVVKYGLAFDLGFARWLAASWDRILARKSPELLRIVATSATWKAKIVSQDERDSGGPREFLNFGHTLGHALESSTEYGHFTHGEAIAWGMRAALVLSKSRFSFPEADLGLAISLLDRLPKRPAPKSLRWSAVLAALRRDKKARDSKNVFILLRRIGRPVKVTDVSAAELTPLP